MTQTRRELLRNTGLLSLAFAAPWQMAVAEENGRTPLLRWVPSTGFSVVDPMFSTSYSTQTYALLVFDTLFGLDENYEPQLQMAESHSVDEDGLRHVIVLREGLTFHDGKPVLAEDCVASIKRWTERQLVAQTLKDAMDTIEAADEKTIVVNLKEPLPLLAALLARPHSGCTILPASQASSMERIDRPVGSGPYKMVWDEWVQGSLVVFERYEDYVPRPNDEPARFNAGAKIAMVDRIEWQTVPDPATAVAAIQAGEVDGIENISMDYAPILEALPSVKLYKNDIPLMGVLRFNQLQPPFDDPKVRRAVLMVADQKDFMAAAVGGDNADFFDSETGFFAPKSPMASKRGLEILTSPRDYEKAREILKEAGVFGTEITVVDTVSISILHNFALVAIDMFKKLGFEVKVETLDWGATLQMREVKKAPSEGGYNVVFTALTGINNLDPIGHIALRAVGEEGTFGWPESEALESLRDKWMNSNSTEERVAIAADLQEQAFKDVPYVPLGSIYGVDAMLDSWTGHQSQMTVFYTLRKE